MTEDSIDEVGEDILSDQRQCKVIIDLSVFKIKDKLNCDFEYTQNLEFVCLQIPREGERFSILGDDLY